MNACYRAKHAVSPKVFRGMTVEQQKANIQIIEVVRHTSRQHRVAYAYKVDYSVYQLVGICL